MRWRVTCDDDNPCTDDSCEPALGCVFLNHDRSRDDENACRADDRCFEGRCVGVPITCIDDNPCTNDACMPATGCIFPPLMIDWDTETGRSTASQYIDYALSLRPGASDAMVYHAALAERSGCPAVRQAAGGAGARPKRAVARCYLLVDAPAVGGSLPSAWSTSGGEKGVSGGPFASRRWQGAASSLRPRGAPPLK